MSFTFPCLRLLRMRLGEFDAVVECMELAVCEFLAGARAAPSIQNYITQLSEKHGVRVNMTDLGLFRHHTAQLYLVTVHQNFEEFLTNFKKELPGSKEWRHIDGVDLLTRVARNIEFDIRSGHESVEYKLAQYYRNIRNSFVHPTPHNQRSDDESEIKSLRVAALSAGYAKLDAPNCYPLVNFDDFVLFTRCAKKLAADLCTVGRPDDRVLASIAWAKADEAGTSKKLSNNPDRLRKAIARFLLTEYSLELEEAERIASIGPLA